MLTCSDKVARRVNVNIQNRIKSGGRPSNVMVFHKHFLIIWCKFFVVK